MALKARGLPPLRLIEDMGPAPESDCQEPQDASGKLRVMAPPTEPLQRAMKIQGPDFHDHDYVYMFKQTRTLTEGGPSQVLLTGTSPMRAGDAADLGQRKSTS